MTLSGGGFSAARFDCRGQYSRRPTFTGLSPSVRVGKRMQIQRPAFRRWHEFFR